MKKFAFLVLVFLLGNSFSNKITSLHEFHISKCNIDLSEKEQTLQITLHIFIDDLEEALRQLGKDKLFICTEKEHEEAEKYILNYLNQSFTIEVNDKEVEYEFLGKEISQDLAATWMYLEVQDVQSLESLKVKYDLLTEVFDDQKNIIQIKGPNKQKGFFLFEKGKTEDSVKF